MYIDVSSPIRLFANPLELDVLSVCSPDQTGIVITSCSCAILGVNTMPHTIPSAPE